MTWMQVEAFLEQDDRCVLPLGSTEQHAYISLATDAIVAERLACEAAEPLGVPVFPVLSYGITPYFMAYPGTVTISPLTYERILTEALGSLRRHGFRRVLLLNGHGGNTAARPAVDSWAEGKDISVLWHDWWKAPQARSVIDSIDPGAGHASWMETFPWTRVSGVELPSGRKARVETAGRAELSLSRLRALAGDGSFGGYYERAPEQVDRVWRTAVDETRALLESGWGES